MFKKIDNIFDFMTNKELINYYNYGYELGADDQDFPKWFENQKQKVACLLGYNDFHIGITKEESEILEEISNIFGK